MSAYPDEIKTAAKMMYLRRAPVKNIKEHLNLNSERIVYIWAKKGNWDEMLQHETVEQATSRRLITVIEKENKTEDDFKELDRLGNLLDKIAGIDAKKARAATQKAKAATCEQRGENTKSKKSKNDISGITPEALKKIRADLFFEYQARWYEHKNERTRFILKSRQIGATFFFAIEAFEDAVLTGDNQLFISASRKQADVFKAYIIHFAREQFDIELKGADVIILSNGAELRFISTNSSTAQSYHGHLYLDEVFWMPDFEKLNKLASAMASHKKWRKTYFSTPSVKSHGAYTFWNGEKFNERRKRKGEFDVSHATLKHGVLGPDKVWRNVVTVVDAQKQGCNLFDIEQLKLEYTEAEFNNLYMCAFLEAGQSVFKLDDLLSAAVDSSVIWVDFKRKQRRPFGNHPVWIGYDPARNGDQSRVVVIAPPLVEGGKYRVLEILQLKGTYTHQANRIKELINKYNVQFIGIDATGPGVGVYEQVSNFFPRATAITYGLNTKTQLVLKAVDVVESRRIEWDAKHTDIPQSFLQVHQTTTGKDHITYESNRNAKTGHADTAWAIMNALHNEPLSPRRKSSMAMAS